MPSALRAGIGERLSVFLADHPACRHLLALQPIVLHRAVGDDRGRDIEHHRRLLARRNGDRERIGAEQRFDAAPGRHVVGAGDHRVDADHAVLKRHRGIDAGRAGVVRCAARRPRRRRSRAPARPRSRPRAPSPDGPCRCRRRPARSPAAVFSTRMSGRGLMPPPRRRRTYCGSRNTPWASAPVRSASSISSATLAASSAGNPTSGKRVRDEGFDAPATAMPPACPCLVHRVPVSSRARRLGYNRQPLQPCHVRKPKWIQRPPIATRHTPRVEDDSLVRGAGRFVADAPAARPGLCRVRAFAARRSRASAVSRSTRPRTRPACSPCSRRRTWMRPASAMSAAIAPLTGRGGKKLILPHRPALAARPRDACRRAGRGGDRRNRPWPRRTPPSWCPWTTTSSRRWSTRAQRCEPDAPQLWPEAPGNIAVDWPGPAKDPDANAHEVDRIIASATHRRARRGDQSAARRSPPWSRAARPRATIRRPTATRCAPARRARARCATTSSPS